MRKLIETIQDNAIECDGCDYVIPNKDPQNPDDSKEYIDVPCPECGENLLTKEDYLLGRKFDKRIDFINKYFGWLSYIFPTSVDVTNVKIHDGVKVENGNR